VTSQWTPARLGDLSGQRIIVTGATNGVGLGTARALARAGAHVVLAVRNLELGAQRAAEIGGDTSIVKIDLADQSSVRSFADSIDADVDILINNAGLVAQSRSETLDGFESTMGTNFLGPFALTNLLFERVREKIINVGSDAHKSSTIAFDDPHLRVKRWSAFPAYGRSKLAVMLWGLELDRRLREAGSPITSYLTHPGFVSSNLAKVSESSVMSGFHKVVQAVANVVGNDIDAGAAPTLYCITEPIAPGSYVGIDGRFGFKGGPTLSGRTSNACDFDAAAKLWDFAEKETGTTLPVKPLA
jgi:NAD(P)-dependent dehydrogenase (short-subunit alcohol dehydrogenase family)